MLTFVKKALDLLEGLDTETQGTLESPVTEPIDVALDMIRVDA